MPRPKPKAVKRAWAKTLPSGVHLYANAPFVGTDGSRTYTVMLERRGERPQRMCTMVGPALTPVHDIIHTPYGGFPGVPEALEEARRLFAVECVMSV